MFTNILLYLQYASRDKSCGYVQISSNKSIIILIMLAIIMCREKKWLNVQLMCELLNQIIV